LSKQTGQLICRLVWEETDEKKFIFRCFLYYTYLSHGGQKTLWIKEACHPENLVSLTNSTKSL